MRRPLSLIAALLVCFASGNALLAGCGGGSKSETATETPAPAPEATPTDTSASAAPAGAIAQDEAAKIFKEKCSTCHGPEGRGDGPLSASLTPKPRNYHDAAYMNSVTDEQLYNSIFNGKSAMPAWGKTKVLTEPQIRGLITYVRSLQHQS